MATLIAILIVLASIALVLVVIVQKSKGGGLAASFSSANNIMGVRKATDGIEKATWYLMGTVMVLSIAYTSMIGSSQEATDTLNKQIEQKASTTPKLPSSLGGDQGNNLQPNPPQNSEQETASKPAN